MPTCLANGKDIKDDLFKLNIPPGAKLFTTDTMLMYTNLPTKQAIVLIDKYLMENRDIFCHLPITAIRDTLCIIMIMNIFIFGNIHWLQETEASMETPPAPTYAQTTSGTHEIKMIIHFISSFLLYKRYIDNIISVWVPRDDPTTEDIEWKAFKTLLNIWFDLE
eukprot:7469317-Ditylum_brightwellii.AAC.1